MNSGGALDGIRVIELANYVSGPYAGMMLADFGAEVIKIEVPGTGDPFRGWGAVDYSPTFGSVNRSKKSVVLDLKSADGQAAAKSLIAGADVVVENFRPGTLERLGLGFEHCRANNPRLIWCSITGFGNFGPLADRPGYDTVGQAMGGLLSVLTDMDAPKPMGISFADHLAGMVACNGILAALQARHRTGKGQRVDTSLLEATVSFIGENAARYFENGEVPDRATRTHTAQVFAFVAGDGKPFVIHLSSPEKVLEGACPRRRPSGMAGGSAASTRASRRQKNYDVLHGALARGVRHEGPRALAAAADRGGRALGPALRFRGSVRRSAGAGAGDAGQGSASLARRGRPRPQRGAAFGHAGAHRPCRARSRRA